MKPNTPRHVDYYLPAEFPAALRLTNGENAVHLAVSYHEGGTNMFSGLDTARCYAVSVSAVKREDGCTSFVIGGSGYGRRFAVAPATRFNAKLLAAVDAAIQPKHAEIVALALRADYDGLRALLTASTAEIGQPKAKAPLTTIADAIAQSNATHAPTDDPRTARLAELEANDGNDPTSVDYPEWQALKAQLEPTSPQADEQRLIRSLLTRRALPTLLHEAAAAKGVTLTQVHVEEQGGRLAYRIGDGTAAYTPGETAERLGVSWP